MNAPSAKSSVLPALDALTGGAFSAPTSSERTALIRAWLERNPSAEQINDVFRELSGRDKGAARFVRERLDELRRERAQETLAVEWAQRARDLLGQSRMNLADGMAWQRDAAKAGAPLGREPLATLKQQLGERVRGIDDLQRRVQIQREAAVLLAQRIETLSTKPWLEALAQCEGLERDWTDWSTSSARLADDPHWASIDPRHPPLLDGSRAQLESVWQAFAAAVAQGRAAAQDPGAALPAVPVWADEIRQAREAAHAPAQARRSEMAAADAASRVQANEKVAAALAVLEGELSQGHGKASIGAANALRQALKDHGRWIDDTMDRQAHAALASAHELGAWHRWRADQLRLELVRRAEALAAMVPRADQAQAPGQVTDTAPPPSADPAPALAPESALVPGQGEGAPACAAPEDGAAVPTDAGSDPTEAGSDAPAPEVPEARALPGDTAALQAPGQPAVDTPAATGPASAGNKLGGRKMQEALRQLREQWKQADQGGVPNHALWRRFDDACTRAHEVVDVWLKKLKAAEARHRAERQALVGELRTWTEQRLPAASAARDFKGMQRELSRFAERWRESGHLSDKAFHELQGQWKLAIDAASAPLRQEQRASIERREALIGEATTIGAGDFLRIDAVRQLQQRWQGEAQAVPLERKLEQRLWDRFRKPIDEAFARKTQAREQAMAALGERDRGVIAASKALAAANAAGDAQQIRAAMEGLQRAMQATHTASGSDQGAADDGKVSKAIVGSSDIAINSEAISSSESPADPASPSGAPADAPAANVSAANSAPNPAAPPAVTRVLAVRGDDRPGAARAGAVKPGNSGGPELAGRRDHREGRDGRTLGRNGPGRFGDSRGPSREGGTRGPAARDGGPRGFGARDSGPRGFGAREGGRDFQGRDEAPRGPRLGDEAFRAQRDAMDHAQQALRKLAAQAHGEAVMGVIHAWERRDSAQLPAARDLSHQLKPAVHQSWGKALAAGALAGDGASTALLRLEMAAEVPTPAAHLDARRVLQLQLLTRRNDPSPAQTWGEDVARVLATAHEPDAAKRLLPVLKVLLRK